MGLNGLDFVLDRESQNWSDFHSSSFEVRVIALGEKPSNGHYSRGARTGPARSSEDDIDFSQGWSCRIIPPGFRIYLAPAATGVVQQMF